MLKPVSPSIKEADKHTRARLDLVAQETMTKWSEMLVIAHQLTGKTKQFTRTECELIIAELRKRVR